MDRQKNFRKRVVRRRHVANRLEEDLWALAYEQVWPLFCQAVSGRSRARSPGEASRPSSHSVPITRRA